jgi:hypothetical protein
MKPTDKTPNADAEQTTPADGEPTMKQLFAMFLESRQADQQITREQLKQTKPPSNKRPPEISVFNPQGQKDFPMPDLAFDVLAPWPMTKGRYHPLTVEEVTLMNRVKPGEAVLELTDDSSVHCSIIATANMTSRKIERIALMGPRDPDSNSYQTLFSKERRHVMPSMVNMLHQILDQQGTDYSDIPTMKQIHARIALPVTDPHHLAVSVGE